MKNNTGRFVKNIASTVLWNITVCRRVENSELKAHHWQRENVKALCFK
jgi:hypothetical protein